jgi:hypothetical protein
MATWVLLSVLIILAYYSLIMTRGYGGKREKGRPAENIAGLESSKELL